jgi:hypothetical protein
MKTPDHELSQLNLFPFDPAIKNLGVVDVTLKGGALEVKMLGATEACDLSMLNPEQWAKAAAAWLVRLTSDKEGLADAYLEAAKSQFFEELEARAADEEIGYAKNRKVVNFGGVKP